MKLMKNSLMKKVYLEVRMVFFFFFFLLDIMLMVSVKEGMGFEQLTRRHGIKVPVGIECSVEECSLAVGQMIGDESIRLASRMNSVMVLFLDSVEKMNKIVEQRI